MVVQSHQSMNNPKKTSYLDGNSLIDVNDVLLMLGYFGDSCD